MQLKIFNEMYDMNLFVVGYYNFYVDLSIFMKNNILANHNFIIHFVPKLVGFTFSIIS